MVIMKRKRMGLQKVNYVCGVCLIFLVIVLMLYIYKNEDNVGAVGNVVSQSPINLVQKQNSNSRFSADPNTFTADELLLFSNGYTDETDRRFLRYIRQRWLVAPSQGPKNITTRAPGNDFSQFGQSTFVDKVLKHKENGFFIECGAADGQTFSNTLFFEIERSWTGLLIEPNPEYFKSILFTKRNSFSINSCLSTSKSTQLVTFKPLGLFGGVDGKMDDTHLKFVKRLAHYKTKDIIAQCFTLYSILSALGQTVVDYFSLDVEGPELEILQTIPFDKLQINIVSVEYRLSDNVQINEVGSIDKLDRIRNFFEDLGNYKELGIVPWGSHENKKMEEGKGLDVIFQRI